MKPLPVGKLPSGLLAELISSIPHGDDVVIGPGIGRDAAAVRVGDVVLVLKTDPITFPTADAGSYLVHVNANDIACMGAEAKWLLVTALLPENATTPELVETIFTGVQSACSAVGCSLIGGHTEITTGLDRPILVGQMVGVTHEDSLLNPANIRAGDALLLAAGIAIEGTSILAVEAREQLAGKIDSQILASAERFAKSPGISVVEYARTIQHHDGLRVLAMHDPTEGGLATGIQEMAEASGLGIEIDEDSVPVYDETRAIAEVLDLDPWGLIASGALLFAVPSEQAKVAISALEAQSVPVSRIGTFIEDPSERKLISRQGKRDLPTFEVDEIARYFSQR